MEAPEALMNAFRIDLAKTIRIADPYNFTYVWYMYEIHELANTNVTLCFLLEFGRFLVKKSFYFET